MFKSEAVTDSNFRGTITLGAIFFWKYIKEKDDFPSFSFILFIVVLQDLYIMAFLYCQLDSYHPKHVQTDLLRGFVHYLRQ